VSGEALLQIWAARPVVGAFFAAPGTQRAIGPSLRPSPKELAVPQDLAHIALVVRDYDEAIAFYTGKLGFELVEDSYQPEQDKRWVIVKPKGPGAASLLLARASNDHQAAYIGDQAGGRVFLFLKTDDFWRDYQSYLERGIEFVREPKTADYGTVAVFKDLYGNLWDLVEFSR
jgi:catechol 2,3-dioxygenase-like lactoylglutathione lyase family enzyme